MNTLYMHEPVIISTLRFSDPRGYNAILYDSSVKAKLTEDFRIVQINQGFSIHAHTLRGLHYQISPHEQAKLCFCLTGSVYNVAVNLEIGEVYTADLKPGMAMFIPRGFAHGYMTLEDNTLFQWCVDNYFCPEAARIVRYDSCKIDWPVKDWNTLIISDKDKAGELLRIKE